MWLRVLGSAAGGGSPQWNCGCPVCTTVRRRGGPARTQSSIAVSADGERWFLVNASPDVHNQIEAFPELHPRGGRRTPIEAVLLTDAELDHTLGLLLLREAASVRLFATAAVHTTLVDGSGVLRTLEQYCAVEWHEVVPGTDVPLTPGLTCRAFDVPTTKRDRFGLGSAPGPAPGHGRVVGYRLTDQRTGRSAVLLPGVQALTPAVRAEIAGAACLLIDGTCFADDEVPGKTSHDMGHLPVSDSLGLLPSLGADRTIYVHVNNTNPILLDDSPQRRTVESHGAEVAVDGLEVEV